MFIRIPVRRARAAAAALALASVLCSTASAQTNPMVGTWNLSLAKSSFSPGPPPRGATGVIVAAAGGLRGDLDVTDPQGNRVHAVYTVICDGQPHPVTGDGNIDAMTCRQIDPSHQEFTGMKGARAATNGTASVSADGKTLTFTVKGVNAAGQPTNDVLVYDRQ